MTFFLSTLYFVVLWIFLYFYKDNKKEQLIWSFIGLFLGPIAQILHTSDWWHPSYLYPQSFIHIEDMLFGFFVCGITATVYDDLFGNKKVKLKNHKKHFYYILFLLLTTFFSTFIAFYIFKLHSFYCVILSFLILFAGIFTLRKDLLNPMLWSGVLMLIICIPFYYIGIKINPSWIINEWYLSKLSGYLVYGVPIEEFIWFFFTGVSFSCLWEALFSYRYSKN